MKRVWIFAPLIGFAVIAVFLGLGLKNDPRLVPSPLIDKPAPAFSLPALNDETRQITNADLDGQVWLLNVWASWCAACRVEHPVLLDMAGDTLMVGLNYKDTVDGANNWLRAFDDPYDQIMVDADGLVGIDFGVYGVPETFVIDKQGQIRLKHIGPVSPEDATNMLALVKELEAE